MIKCLHSIELLSALGSRLHRCQLSFFRFYGSPYQKFGVLGQQLRLESVLEFSYFLANQSVSACINQLNTIEIISKLELLCNGSMISNFNF